MPLLRLWGIYLGALSLLLMPLFLVQSVSESPPVPEKKAVKLAVLICFDQMRGDYLTRWRSLFGPEGFNRLIDQGVWFDQCYYPYSGTLTGAGHASISTGCSPNVHGIIANNWYDTRAAASVYCASESRFELIPQLPPDPEGKKTSKPQGPAPTRQLAPSLGDALKTATSGKGRVFALSIKDRSAVLPAGQQPDVCYWFNSERGQWVTSTFYRDRVHPWVADLNRTNPAEKYFDRVWEKLPGVDHVKHAGPDNVPGEGYAALGFTSTFPHPIVGDKNQTVKSRTEAVVTTPWGNDMLMEAVEKLMEAEKPGSREIPDFLSISFSSNDLCGHAFGPDSQEVLDITLRSDQLVARLFKLLDEKVGAGNYSVALTADHGVCPLPEVSNMQGLVARRIDTGLLKRRAVDYLRATYPTAVDEKTAPIAYLDSDLVYFNSAWLKNSGLDAAEVEQKLANWFREQSGIVAAFTRTYLSQAVPPSASNLERLVRKSWHPDRSGDIYLVTAPYHLKTTYRTGTSHGTPHDYDRHVPLLVFGPGLGHIGASRHDVVTPQAAAVILARTLGIPAPAKADTPVPDRLFR